MYSDNRLSKFEKVVFDDANAKAQKIILDANKTAEKIVKEAQNKAKKQSKEMLFTSSVKSQKEYASSSANSEFSAKRELILKRKEYTENLFLEISKKISDFTKTEDYKKYLLNAVNSAKNEYKTNAILEVRKEDEELCKTLFSEKIKAVNDIKVGGIRIIFTDEKVSFDKTFDEALITQKTKFINKSGLNIG